MILLGLRDDCSNSGFRYVVNDMLDLSLVRRRPRPFDHGVIVDHVILVTRLKSHQSVGTVSGQYYPSQNSSANTDIFS